MNDKVKELRKHLNLTQKEFGERIGLKPNSISDIENGKNSLTDIVLKSICKEFNVNKDWLKTGKGEMFVDVLPEDELGAYLGKIGTGDYPEIERIIKAYFRLPEESQRAVDQFLKSLAGDAEN